MLDFTPFPKLARLSRDCVITEKLDGTNAQIYIRVLPDDEVMPAETPIVAVRGKFLIYAGSRNRWITPGDDNYGFASWVEANADDLIRLGPGNHFGEWWGSGIQRKYNLTEKRFSLFNVHKWAGIELPPGVHVVPTLSIGTFSSELVEKCMSALRSAGSAAAPGFPNPEGIVVFHTASRTLFKKTLVDDEKPKSVAIPQ